MLSFGRTESICIPSSFGRETSGILSEIFGAPFHGIKIGFVE